MSAFARSYASAFFQTLPEGSDAAGFLRGAEAIRQAISQDARLKAFVGSPAVPHDAKRKVVEELTGRVGLDEFGRRFFQVLLEHKRLLSISEILSAIRLEADRRSGVVEARVTLAAPPDAQERRQIEEALTRAAGRPVRLSVDVDETILAGFVAKIASEIFDASVLRAIETFRRGAEEAKAD